MLPVNRCSAYVTKRSGTVLIAVVVSLAVIMALLTAGARLTLQSSSQMARWHDQEQARWLVEAGAERAAFQWARDANYRGETLTVECTSSRKRGQISITANQTTENRQATVTVRYPAGDITGIQQTKTFLFQESHHELAMVHPSTYP